MRKNISPWLHQLDTSRASVRLAEDLTTDVTIIGAGIAGISTAFEILEQTHQRVVVLESSKLAHGATGHNAGQLIAHFERGLESIAQEYGIEKAVAAQRAIESGWDILERIYTTARLDIPYFSFIGHTGLTSKGQVLMRLENNRVRVAGGLTPEALRIADTSAFVHTLDAKYQGLYSIVPLHEVQEALETERTDFIAVLSYRKGCLNSALFCQEVLRYLEQKYPDRFSLYEHTPAHKLVLRNHSALIDAGEHVVKTSRVVLCTNGFENIRIFSENGLDIDAKYHHLVSGTQGFMSGYLEQRNKEPIAISYFTDPSTDPENSYYYLTRRPYEYEKGKEHNLICIGGPDIPLEESLPYSRDLEYPDECASMIDQFVKSTYDLDPNKKIEYQFTWHGLMGYTRSGIRMVGPEPKNPVLLYNLGCNGIGILPALYGATKIVRHLSGEDVEISLFDVPARVETPGRTRSSLLSHLFRSRRE